MVETFEGWLRDSIAQSLFLSPIMGVVFGALFTFVTKGKPQESAKSVRETVIIIKEKIIYRDRSSNNNNDPNGFDPFSLFFVFIFAIILTTYFYALFADLVVYYSSILAFNFIAFGFTSLILSAFQSKVTGADWIAYTLLPVLILLFSLVLLHYAQEGIAPWMKERALKVGAIEFYFDDLSENNKNWVMAQLMGLVLAVVYLIMACVLVLHNTSALQVRYGGFMQNLWAYIYAITYRFSGWGMMVIVGVIGLGSLLMLNGAGYEFLMNRRLS